MLPPLGGFPVDHRILDALKAFLALAATALLLWDARFRPQSRLRRLRKPALAACGLLSLAAWFNFGALNGRAGPLQLHDFFHYYIGSKYFAELGYTRIYQCVAVEEVQRGRLRDVSDRWTRNLLTNDLERHVPTSDETAECLAGFSPARWRAFSHDVEWFHRHMRPATWAGIFDVFGHNATPVWNTMGYWLTRWGPVSRRQILTLAAIDPVLLLMMWLVLWRTFGWEAAAVGAVWWGLNEPSGYAWIGGAFLRQDGLFLIACAVCALRTRRNMFAGAALAAAALLRAFPAVLLIGLAIKAAYGIRRRGVAPTLKSYRSLMTGFIIASSILLAVTTLTWRGPWNGALEPWKGFAANSQKHLSTAVTTHLGLKAVLSFSSQSRAANTAAYWIDSPWDTWRAARDATFERRKLLYGALLAAFVAWFALSVAALDDWVVVVMSIALLPFASNLANYYYSVLLFFGLLWSRDKLIGAGLAALAALTTIQPALFAMRDDRYVVVSLGIVLYAVFVLARARHLLPGAEEPEGPSVRAAGSAV